MNFLRFGGDQYLSLDPPVPMPIKAEAVTTTKKREFYFTVGCAILAAIAIIVAIVIVAI